MKKNILGLVFTINRKIKIPYYLQYETKDYCETFFSELLVRKFGKRGHISSNTKSAFGNLLGFFVKL